MAWENATCIPGYQAVSRIGELHETNCGNLLVMRSPTLARTLLRKGLADELHEGLRQMCQSPTKQAGSRHPSRSSKRDREGEPPALVHSLLSRRVFDRRLRSGLGDAAVFVLVGEELPGLCDRKRCERRGLGVAACFQARVVGQLVGHRLLDHGRTTESRDTRARRRDTIGFDIVAPSNHQAGHRDRR